MSSTRIPYNTGKIPNRWEITHDPQNRHAGEIQLAYYGEDTNKSPDCLIHVERNGIQTETPPKNRYHIKVQDINADGSDMSTPLPVAIKENHDSQLVIEERLIELSKEYPRSETLSA